MKTVNKSNKLDNVCYDIRGPILTQAQKMEDEGHRILKLNIGNPAPFGFEAPDDIVKDVIRNLPSSQGYSDANGLYAARVAVMQYYQQKNIRNIAIEDVTSDWAKFTMSRAKEWRRNKDDLIQLHGNETWEKLDKFYSVIQELFEGTRLRGVIVIAEKPMGW